MRDPVLASALQEFPDYDTESRYEAALGLYHLRIATKVFERHTLTTLARFILRAIAQGADSVAELTHLLGLEEADLVVGADELFHAELIARGTVGGVGERLYGVTPKGQQYLIDSRSLFVPHQKTFHVHFDPLTRQLRPREAGVLSIDQVKKEGIFVIPAKGPSPTLGDVELRVLAGILEQESAEIAESQIVALLSMGDPYMEYLRGIDVLVLRHRRTNESRIAVFRGPKFLAAESEAIQSLEQQGLDVKPSEAVDARIDFAAGEFLTSERAVAAQEIVERDHEARELQLEIDRQETRQSATQDRLEREELNRQVQELKDKLDGVKNERDRLKNELRHATNNGIDVLSTEDHRAVLEQALSESERELLIISPWMNLRTIDEHLCSLIDQALRRGVRIRIAYGFPYAENGAEGERSRGSARAVIDKVKRYTRYLSGPKLQFVDMRLGSSQVKGTHEKMLVCDRNFAVVTSFNWLSYRGDVDSEFRRETGVLFRDPDGVERVAQRALEVFSPAVGDVRPAKQGAVNSGHGPSAIRS